MSFTVTDGTTVNDVLDYEMIESVNELDTCAILSTGKYTDNVALTVLDGSTTLFAGFQKNAETNENNSTLFDLTIREKAAEMQYVILESSGATAFNKTDTVTNLVDWVCTQVNTAYGYTGSDAWSRDSSCTDATSLTIGCYYTNALSFLKKVVIENRGLKLWFDSSTKKVSFGTYRTDRSASNISYIRKKELRDSNKRGCTKVTVVGKDKTIYYTAGTGNVHRVFSYTEATTATECQNVATQLLAELGSANVQYEIEILTTTACDPGDKIKIDGTIAYVVKVKNNIEKATVTTGTSTESLLDSLGSRITEISGETVSGSDASWNSGAQNVAANAASATQFILNIEDKDLISNFNLDATIGSFVKAASVSTETDRLSDVSTVNSTTYSTDSTGFNTTTYLPSTSGLSVSGISNGTQFAVCQVTGTLRTASAGYAIQVVCQYSTNRSSWYSAGNQAYFYLNSTSVYYPFSFTSVIPGTTGSTLYVRWGFAPDTATFSLQYQTDMSVQCVSRHYHSLTTTYDKTTTGTPPTTLQVSINGGTYFTLTPGTPLDKTSSLIDGKNTFDVKTPASAGNQCSATLSATYKTLGKS